MPVIPSSLDSLLFLFAGAFDARTFVTFRYLVVGFLARVGEHSVCGMLVGARLERVWHHSLAHAFFAYRQWQPDRLGLILLQFVVRTFVPADAAVKLAMDDTLFKRSGKQVWGATWQYDGSQSSGHGPKIAYGNNFVVMTVIVRLQFIERAVSLPVLCRLWRPDPEARKAKRDGVKHKRNPEYPSKPELGREMLELVVARFPDREIRLVGDSAYATRAFRDLGERVLVTSRLKSNAALYAPRPPRTGKRGQPAKKGKRLGSLQQIAATADWKQTPVTRSGKRRTVLTHAFEALFYDVWGERPVQVLLVKDAKRTNGYDIALVTMDTTAGPAQIIEDYDERWSIEVSIEDAKQITGVGQARNRVQKAVERTVPFGLLCQSLTICWYAQNGHAQQDVAHRRRHARWYTHKRTPSYQDMLASLRRTNITAQYSPVTSRAPKPREIPSTPAALKAAAG